MILQTFSSTEELDEEYDFEMANRWTPETGFKSQQLKINIDSYPRPGVGMKIFKNKTKFYYRFFHAI